MGPALRMEQASTPGRYHDHFSSVKVLSPEVQPDEIVCWQVKAVTFPVIVGRFGLKSFVDVGTKYHAQGQFLPTSDLAIVGTATDIWQKFRVAKIWIKDCSTLRISERGLVFTQRWSNATQRLA